MSSETDVEQAIPDVGMLDTSTLIWSGRLDVELLPPQTRISAVTLAELSVGPLVAQTDADRAARQAHLQLAQNLEALPFDERCAAVFAPIAAKLRQAGSKSRARAYDTLIAATAIANHLPLYTGNPDDFDGIPELDVRPVPSPTD